MPAHNSIRTIGLKRYLTETAELHNGWNYLDFRAMVAPNWNKEKKQFVGINTLARIWNVSPGTMNKLLIIYLEEEQA